MKTNLWLPESARDPAPDRKVMHCHLCGEDWPPERVLDFQGHLPRCVSEHRDDIDAESRARAEHPANWVPDPEIREHMDRVGERMIRERRLVVRKNERAGF